MQFRRSVGMGVLVGLLLLTGVILGVLVWDSPESLGLAAGSDRQMIWNCPVRPSMALAGLTPNLTTPWDLPAETALSL
ncbi:hypothetical protein PS691_00851 [Pseudomonas fluorescens]|uniref:Uncharacterized protein n=1 Tax=Pseudomonas fluorescens TaxID=294 RepID=A0A5E7AHK1_PSEFL|nr:hypothetical protein PS691_00851 [Pseudomonas fluorescens]